MRSTIVMTVIGPDRPGLVEELSGVVSKHHGNWLDSRMVHLAGEFAGVVKVEIASDRAAALQDDLSDLARRGLRVVVQGTPEPPATGGKAGPTVTFQLVGQDRPGIIASVSRVFANHGANVEELHSGCSSAPMTGDTLFEARARLSLPEGISLDELRASLEKIAADLMVDVSLEPEDQDLG